jgi:hypothetical protein
MKPEDIRDNIKTSINKTLFSCKIKWDGCDVTIIYKNNHSTYLVGINFDYNDMKFVEYIERQYDKIYNLNSNTIDEKTFDKINRVFFKICGFLMEGFIYSLSLNKIDPNVTFNIKYTHSTNYPTMIYEDEIINW